MTLADPDHLQALRVIVIAPLRQNEFLRLLLIFVLINASYLLPQELLTNIKLINYCSTTAVELTFCGELENLTFLNLKATRPLQ